jgi:RNA polymerase sigma-70 factor, ECF subfamily
VQTAFVRLWQSRPSDAHGARLATYFNTIVINGCRNLLVRRRELATDPVTLQVLVDGGAEPTTAGQAGPTDSTAARTLASAMQQLPARQRLALAMWAHGDASAAEIARALDIDTNAAHQLLHRARQSLRRCWPGKEPR